MRHQGTKNTVIVDKGKIYEAQFFSKLPELARKWLIDWFNNGNPSQPEKQMLLNIYKTKKFNKFTCDHCGGDAYYVYGTEGNNHKRKNGSLIKKACHECLKYL